MPSISTDPINMSKRAVQEFYCDWLYHRFATQSANNPANANRRKNLFVQLWNAQTHQLDIVIKFIKLIKKVCITNY